MVKLFSSGQELANLVVSSDVLDICFDALSKLHDQPADALIPSVTFDEYGSRNVLSFVVSRSDVDDGLLLGLGEKEGALIKDHFSFISTKVNASFSINKAAIKAFASLSHQNLKEKINSLSETLIITGQALAGSVASLFTLWLQQNVMNSKTNKIKRLVCITFGSPLVGDGSFSNEISERPSWSSCFVHVVSNRDPIPRSFVSTHRPFGTYLFCSESGDCACFDDSESILAVMRMWSVQNNKGTVDYRAVLKKAKENTLKRGSSHLGDPNPLHEGINLQLEGIGALNPQDTTDSPMEDTTDSPMEDTTDSPMEDITDSPMEDTTDSPMEDTTDSPREDTTGRVSLMEEIAKRQKKLIMKKRNVYEPTKKLNDMKISLSYMEWYMKRWRSRAGYYDTYKDPKGQTEDESKQEIVKHKRQLVQYWKEMVKEKEKSPQKEGGNMRVRWLYAGTNYRRIIEPLDIAEYYKQGGTDYLSIRESSEDYRHYKLLEDWFNEDQPNQNPKEAAASLTEDSCFWAHVEEAIISLKAWKKGEKNDEEFNSDMEEFKKYILNLIDNKAVSPDIFLPGSSFMQWWGDYPQPPDDLFKPETWAEEYK